MDLSEILVDFDNDYLFTCKNIRSKRKKKRERKEMSLMRRYKGGIG